MKRVSQLPEFDHVEFYSVDLDLVAKRDILRGIKIIELPMIDVINVWASEAGRKHAMIERFRKEADAAKAAAEAESFAAAQSATDAVTGDVVEKDAAEKIEEVTGSGTTDNVEGKPEEKEEQQDDNVSPVHAEIEIPPPPGNAGLSATVEVALETPSPRTDDSAVASTAGAGIDATGARIHTSTVQTSVADADGAGDTAAHVFMDAEEEGYASSSTEADRFADAMEEISSTEGEPVFADSIEFASSSSDEDSSTKDVSPRTDATEAAIEAHRARARELRRSLKMRRAENEAKKSLEESTATAMATATATVTTVPTESDEAAEEAAKAEEERRASIKAGKRPVESVQATAEDAEATTSAARAEEEPRASTSSPHPPPPPPPPPPAAAAEATVGAAAAADPKRKAAVTPPSSKKNKNKKEIIKNENAFMRVAREFHEMNVPEKMANAVGHCMISGGYWGLLKMRSWHLKETFHLEEDEFPSETINRGAAELRGDEVIEHVKMHTYNAAEKAFQDIAPALKNSAKKGICMDDFAEVMLVQAQRVVDTMLEVAEGATAKFCDGWQARALSRFEASFAPLIKEEIELKREACVGFARRAAIVVSDAMLASGLNEIRRRTRESLEKERKRLLTKYKPKDVMLVAEVMAKPYLTQTGKVVNQRDAAGALQPQHVRRELLRRSYMELATRISSEVDGMSRTKKREVMHTIAVSMCFDVVDKMVMSKLSTAWALTRTRVVLTRTVNMILTNGGMLTHTPKSKRARLKMAEDISNVAWTTMYNIYIRLCKSHSALGVRSMRVNVRDAMRRAVRPVLRKVFARTLAIDRKGVVWSSMHLRHVIIKIKSKQRAKQNPGADQSIKLLPFRVIEANRRKSEKILKARRKNLTKMVQMMTHLMNQRDVDKKKKKERKKEKKKKKKMMMTTETREGERQEEIDDATDDSESNEKAKRKNEKKKRREKAKTMLKAKAKAKARARAKAKKEKVKRAKMKKKMMIMMTPKTKQGKEQKKIVPTNESDRVKIAKAMKKEVKKAMKAKAKAKGKEGKQQKKIDPTNESDRIMLAEAYAKAIKKVKAMAKAKAKAEKVKKARAKAKAFAKAMEKAKETVKAKAKAKKEKEKAKKAMEKMEKAMGDIVKVKGEDVQAVEEMVPVKAIEKQEGKKKKIMKMKKAQIKAKMKRMKRVAEEVDEMRKQTRRKAMRKAMRTAVEGGESKEEIETAEDDGEAKTKKEEEEVKKRRKMEKMMMIMMKKMKKKAKVSAREGQKGVEMVTRGDAEHDESTEEMKKKMDKMRAIILARRKKNMKIKMMKIVQKLMLTMKKWDMAESKKAAARKKKMVKFADEASKDVEAIEEDDATEKKPMAPVKSVDEESKDVEAVEEDDATEKKSMVMRHRRLRKKEKELMVQMVLMLIKQKKADKARKIKMMKEIVNKKVNKMKKKKRKLRKQRQTIAREAQKDVKTTESIEEEKEEIIEEGDDDVGKKEAAKQQQLKDKRIEKRQKKAKKRKTGKKKAGKKIMTKIEAAAAWRKEQEEADRMRMKHRRKIKKNAIKEMYRDDIEEDDSEDDPTVPDRTIQEIVARARLEGREVTLKNLAIMCRHYCSFYDYVHPYKRNMKRVSKVMDFTAREFGPMVMKSLYASIRVIQGASRASVAVSRSLWRLPFIRVPLKLCWHLKYAGLLVLLRGLQDDEEMDWELREEEERENSDAFARYENELTEGERTIGRTSLEKALRLLRKDAINEGKTESQIDAEVKRQADIIDLYEVKKRENMDDKTFYKSLLRDVDAGGDNDDAKKSQGTTTDPKSADPFTGGSLNDFLK